MSTMEVEVVEKATETTERTDEEKRAVERINQASDVLERLLKPRFCESFRTEVEERRSQIEAAACYNLAEGERAAWQLVTEMSQRVAPLYLDNARVQFNKLRYNVLPPEVTVEHERGLDKSSVLIEKANGFIKTGNDRQARRFLQESIEICRTIFHEEWEIKTRFFAERANQSVEEAAKKAADKARQATNRATQAEENRQRAKGGGAGTKTSSSQH